MAAKASTQLTGSRELRAHMVVKQVCIHYSVQEVHTVKPAQTNTKYILVFLQYMHIYEIDKVGPLTGLPQLECCFYVYLNKIFLKFFLKHTHHENILNFHYHREL